MCKVFHFVNIHVGLLHFYSEFIFLETTLNVMKAELNKTVVQIVVNSAGGLVVVCVFL